MTTVPKSEAEARAAGYTRSYLAESSDGVMSGEILVRKGTDFDTQFSAWAVDWNEFCWFLGWNWSFEREEA